MGRSLPHSPRDTTLTQPCPHGRSTWTFSTVLLYLPQRSIFGRLRSQEGQPNKPDSIAGTLNHSLHRNADTRGPLAQLAEQLTLNQRVVGSSPTRLTSELPGVEPKRGGLPNDGQPFLYRRVAKYVAKRFEGTIMIDRKREPLRLFYSYSHRDAKMRDRLQVHLSLLKNQGLIAQWHDRQITAGEEWEGKIDENLERADIILLLISSDFLASKYCHDIEMRRAMERHDAGEARVIPVILHPVLWHGEPFAKLQALPTDAKPVSKWRPQDEGWFDVAKGIGVVVDELGQHLTAQQEANNAGLSPPPAYVASEPGDGEQPGEVGDAAVWAEKSGALLTAGRYEEALAEADRAIQVDPNNIAALHNKAAALDRLGKHNEAIVILDHALSLAPDNAHLWMGLGTALVNLGRFSDAAIAFEHAVKTGPYFAEAWYNLGWALIKSGSPREAVAAYQQAVRVTPDFPSAWYNLGHLLDILGNHEAALVAFDQSLSYRPEDPQTWRHSSVALGNLGRYAEALAVCDRALVLKPDDVHTWYIRGWLEAKLDSDNPAEENQSQ